MITLEIKPEHVAAYLKAIEVGVAECDKEIRTINAADWLMALHTQLKVATMNTKFNTREMAGGTH